MDAHTMLAGDYISKALWRTFWQLLLEFKIYMPYDPSIPFLSVCPRETLVHVQNGQCTRMLLEVQWHWKHFSSQLMGNKEITRGVIGLGHQSPAATNDTRSLVGYTELRATPPVCIHHVCANKHTRRENR